MTPCELTVFCFVIKIEMKIFIIIWSIWFTSEILLNRLFRSGNKDKKNLDQGTIRIIWTTIGICNSLGILSAIFIKFPISSNLLIAYLGLFLITTGMIFRFISISFAGTCSPTLKIRRSRQKVSHRSCSKIATRFDGGSDV
jgi:hypothetical protein